MRTLWIALIATIIMAFATVHAASAASVSAVQPPGAGLVSVSHAPSQVPGIGHGGTANLCLDGCGVAAPPPAHRHGFHAPATRPSMPVAELPTLWIDFPPEHPPRT